MLKRFSYAFLALGLLVVPAMLGCSHVAQTSPAQTNHSGGTWYIRTGSFGALRGIYYCPSSTPGQCIEAEMR